MEKADIVLGYRNSSSDATAWVGQFYSPKNGELVPGALSISKQNFTVSDFNVAMCFTRPVSNGHYDAVDNSYVIFAVGAHSYTLDSFKHTGDPLDRSDSNPSVDWLTDTKMKMTLSDPGATNQVVLSWTRPNPTTLDICVSATGPQVTSRTWIGFGWTKDFGIGSSQYVISLEKNCNHQNDERMGCLSTIGVLFTIVFTYSGFILLAVSTLWNANITEKLKKFREKWKQIREGTR